MHLLRILRGIALTALTWSVGWVLLSLAKTGIVLLAGGEFPSYIFVPYLVTKAINGGLTGGLFAVVLAVAGRRRNAESMSMPWIAVCGAVGAGLMPLVVRMVFPLPASVWAPMIVTNALLGGAGAAVMLAMARRAPALPRGDDWARTRFPGVHTARP